MKRVHKQLLSRGRAFCGHIAALGVRSTADDAKVTCIRCLRLLAPHSASAAARLTVVREANEGVCSHLGDRGFTACGRAGGHCVESADKVTCGTCLRVMAKRRAHA